MQKRGRRRQGLFIGASQARIADYAIDEGQEETSRFQTILNKIWNVIVIDESRIISFRNKKKEKWDVLMIILAMINSFFIPLEMNFDFPVLFHSIIYIIFDNLIDFMFLADLIL